MRHDLGIGRNACPAPLGLQTEAGLCAALGIELQHAELLAQALIGAVHQVSDWWLSTASEDAPAVPREQLRDLLVRLLWSGLPSVGLVDAARSSEDAGRRQNP